jgi:tetratricopeptide (TPR) repeat protein
LQGIYGLFGYLYLERSQSSLAEKYLRKQIEINPEDLQARNALAWAYFMRGDYDLAEVQAKEMIEKNPELINGYTNLGHVLIEKGMFSSAVEQFRKAISIRADVPELHAGLAHALFRKGRLEEAKAAAEEALKLQPETPDPHLTLGLILARKGDLDKARTEAEFLAKSEKASHLSFYLEGHIALQEGKSQKAIEAFRQGRESFPAMSVEYLRGEALAHLQRKAFDEAIGASKQAVGINSHYALSYRDLGLAHRGKGNKVEAREALRSFLDLWKGADEDNSELKEARAILQELGS